ncbi:CHY zinc finger protein [Halobaculum sp. P14]|uniref:CHY zinc finger protein n=1 Tax=Halobaculum sp. P14 TaxID=3421638 RepID=UPI003EB6DBA6
MTDADPDSGVERAESASPLSEVVVDGAVVRGVDVGSETRCAHWDGASDVVAIKFACCETYYPCYRCHDAAAGGDADAAGHETERWPADRFDEPAVLCGACGTELTVQTYVDADDACPNCAAAFNPGCAAHYDRYFAVD